MHILDMCVHKLIQVIQFFTFFVEKYYFIPKFSFFICWNHIQTSRLFSTFESVLQNLSVSSIYPLQNYISSFRLIIDWRLCVFVHQINKTTRYLTTNKKQHRTNHGIGIRVLHGRCLHCFLSLNQTKFFQ